ncbi:cytochrome c biogenesis protein CcsA [bacterium]|nr:cytochrome c biogenesis protein CcsA [bacterium]
MTIINVLLLFAFFTYGLATVFRVLENVRGKPMTNHGFVALLLGLGCHLASLAMTIQETASTQVFHIRTLFLTAPAVLVMVCAFIELRGKETIFSVFILPLAMIFMVISGFVDSIMEGPYYHGPIFLTHVVASVSGECFFLLSAISGMAYLFEVRRLKSKNRLRALSLFPPLARLDSLISGFADVGWLLFTFGLVFGAIWEQGILGTIFPREIKQFTALGVWAIFAAIIGGRRFKGWAGTRIASMAIFGFIGSVILIFLTNTGFHEFP